MAAKKEGRGKRGCDVRRVARLEKGSCDCRRCPQTFEELFDVPQEEFVDAAIEACLEAIDHL